MTCTVPLLRTCVLALSCLVASSILRGKPKPAAAPALQTEPSTEAPQPLFHSLSAVQTCHPGHAGMVPTRHFCGKTQAKAENAKQNTQAMKYESDLSFLDTPLLRQKLTGKTISMMGDSSMEQLYFAMTCALNSNTTNTTLRFFKMDTVPHLKHELVPRLQEAMKDADVFVLNVGLWYNWYPIIEPADEDVTADWATNFVNQRCSRRGENVTVGDDMYGYSRGRRSCRTLTLRAYRSDLMRLRDSLVELSGAGSQAPPVMIWKYTTPQHFMTPGGMFDIDNKRPSHCVATENITASNARNRIAESILLPLMQDGSLSPHHLLYMNGTFAETAKYVDQHTALTDCTHYCINSIVPRLWIADLMQVILRK